jgi:hypothetical protein
MTESEEDGEVGRKRCDFIIVTTTIINNYYYC